MTRRAWAGWCLAVLLAGCGRPVAPVVRDAVAPPSAGAAPGWLPAGWVISATPPATAAERSIQTFTPAGANAPLVMLRRYSPAEVTRLTAQVGDPVAWLTKQSTASLGLTGTVVGRPEAWPRSELPGVTLSVRGESPDGDRGRLSGVVAIGRNAAGGMVYLAALAPVQSDQSFIAQVLRAVPAD